MLQVYNAPTNILMSSASTSKVRQATRLKLTAETLCPSCLEYLPPKNLIPIRTSSEAAIEPSCPISRPWLHFSIELEKVCRLYRFPPERRGLLVESHAGVEFRRSLFEMNRLDSCRSFEIKFRDMHGKWVCFRGRHLGILTRGGYLDSRTGVPFRKYGEHSNTKSLLENAWAGMVDSLVSQLTGRG